MSLRETLNFALNELRCNTQCVPLQGLDKALWLIRLYIVFLKGRRSRPCITYAHRDVFYTRLFWEVSKRLVTTIFSLLSSFSQPNPHLLCLKIECFCLNHIHSIFWNHCVTCYALFIKHRLFKLCYCYGVDHVLTVAAMFFLLLPVSTSPYIV